MRATRTFALVLPLIAALGPQHAEAQGRTGKRNEAETLASRAAEYLTKGNLARAEELYRLAIDRAQLESAYVRLSLLLFSQHRYAEGLKVAEAGLLQHDASSALRAQRGAHRFQLGQVGPAHKDLASVAALLPQDFALQAVTAQCCMAAADLPCVDQAVGRYLASRPPALAHRDRGFRLVRAKAWLRSGRIDEAGSELRRLLSTHPRHLPSQALQAELLLRQHYYTSAAERLGRLSTQLDDEELIIFHGQALLGAKQPDRALAAAERYLLHKPTASQGLLLKADAFAALKRPNASLQALAPLADSAAVRQRRARAYLALGAPKRCLATLQPLLRARPIPQELLVLALQAATAVHAPQLENLAIQAESQDSKISTLVLAARAWTTLGKDERAIALLRQLFARDAGRSAVRRDLAAALLRRAAAAARTRETAELAAKTLEEVLRVIPNSARAAYNLMAIDLQSGNTTRAFALLRAQLKLRPQDYELNRLGARILIALDRRSEAQQLLEQAARTAKQQGNHAPWPLARAIALAEAATLAAAVAKLDLALRYLEAAYALSPHRRGVRPQRATQRTLSANTQPKASPATTAGTPRTDWRHWIEIALIRVLLQRATSSPNQARAQKDLRRARRHIAKLAGPERSELQAIAAVATTITGDPAAVGKLSEPLRKKLAEVVSPAFRPVASALLAAYLDYRSPNVRHRQRAVTALAAIAQRLPTQQRWQLLSLVYNLNQRLAVTYYRKGNLAAAQRALQLVRRYQRGVPSLRQRHNTAVISFASNPRQSLEALRGLRETVGLAACNLAVHHARSGRAERAFELFSSCLAAKGAYPGLAQLVASQDRVRKALQ